VNQEIIDALPKTHKNAILEIIRNGEIKNNLQATLAKNESFNKGILDDDSKLTLQKLEVLELAQVNSLKVARNLKVPLWDTGFQFTLDSDSVLETFLNAVLEQCDDNGVIFTAMVDDGNILCIALTEETVKETLKEALHKNGVEDVHLIPILPQDNIPIATVKGLADLPSMLEMKKMLNA
jgi:hypothetical protein